MMNLEEIRKIVAFMKENGIAELSYEGKGSSITLKLARPAGPRDKDARRPGREHRGVPQQEQHSFEVERPGVELEFSGEEPESVSTEELKKMAKAAKKAAKEAAREAKESAKAAAKEAREAAKEAARAAKAAIKSYQEEYGTPDDEQAEEDALFGAEVSTEIELEGVEEPEAAPAGEQGKTIEIELDTETLRENAKQAAAIVTDAAISTAKLGVQLGKQGLQYLKDKREELLTKSEQSAPAEAPEQPEEPIEITLEAQDEEE